MLTVARSSPFNDKLLRNAFYEWTIILFVNETPIGKAVLGGFILSTDNNLQKGLGLLNHKANHILQKSLSCMNMIVKALVVFARVSEM